MNLSALQRYQLQKQQGPALYGPGDADYIDDDIYSKDTQSPQPNSALDRYIKQRNSGQPMRTDSPMDTVPTTKNRFY